MYGVDSSPMRSPAATRALPAHALLGVLVAVLVVPCASGVDRDDDKANVHAAAQQHILKIQRSLEQGEVAQLQRDMARQAEEVPWMLSRAPVFPLLSVSRTSTTAAAFSRADRLQPTPDPEPATRTDSAGRRAQA